MKMSYQYLIENGIDMELINFISWTAEKKLPYNQARGIGCRCRVSFGKGREIFYTIEKDEEGEVNVMEIKTSKRLTVRKQKKVRRNFNDDISYVFFRAKLCMVKQTRQLGNKEYLALDRKTRSQ